jgi:hypothetical protein
MFQSRHYLKDTMYLTYMALFIAAFIVDGTYYWLPCIYVFIACMTSQSLNEMLTYIERAGR